MRISIGRIVAICLAAALLVTAAGCRRSPPPMGKARTSQPRIVSFSPALTEMLFDMGLGQHVVGVTKYCDLPVGEVRPVVGDRQNVNIEKILTVQPDVILVQQSENDFDTLRSQMPDLKVEHFTIETLDDIAAALERIGRLAGNESLGKQRRTQFEQRLAGVKRRAKGLTPTRVFFLTGRRPLTVAGRDSFIHGMIELAGGDDLSGKYARWTTIDVEGILKAKPDVIICQGSSSRSDEDLKYLQSLQGVPAVKSGRIFIVTDRHWTIPSTRMAELTEELLLMLHPELTSEGNVQ